MEDVHQADRVEFVKKSPTMIHEKIDYWLRHHFVLESVPLREFLAEMAGTFILIAFGVGVVAQVILSAKLDPNGIGAGDFFSINWGWGVGVMLGILVSGNVSGAHLNPSVTITLMIIGKFQWWKMFHYFAGQYLGAFLGSVVVFLTYYDAFDMVHQKIGLNQTTAQIFATYPKPHLSTGGGFLDQVVGTALLLFCVLAITDNKNMKVPLYLVPLYIGFVVLNIGLCFGYNCGYAVNPARDLAPRVFTAMAGWGGQVFTDGNYWFWVPWVASHVGAIIGGIAYVMLIENHWPPEPEPDHERATFHHLKKKHKQGAGGYAPSVRAHEERTFGETTTAPGEVSGN